MEGLSPVLIVADVEMIEEIFIKNFSTFCDNKNYLFHPLLTKGLVTVNGERWRRSRRILGPGFTAVKLRVMSETIESCLTSLTNFLDEKREDEMSNMDMNNLIKRFVVDVTSKVLFGLDGDAYKEDSVFAENARGVTELSIHKLLILVSMPEFVLRYMEFNVTPRGPTDFLIELSKSVLRQRKQSRDHKVSDLMDVLLNSHNGEEGGLTEHEVVANIVHFLIGGFESTSSALSSACYCLAMHPDIQERLRREAMDNQFGEAAKDSFMNAFIQEVLRMYPPFIRSDRTACMDASISLSGQTLEFRAGDRVRLPIYHMNLNEYLFQDAKVFNPDRFMPGGVSCDSLIYSFTIGTRNCIGENFARLIMRLKLAHLVRNYSILRSPQTAEQLDFSSSHFLLNAKNNFIALKKLDTRSA